MTNEDTRTIAWRNDSEIAAISDISPERLRHDVERLMGQAPQKEQARLDYIEFIHHAHFQTKNCQ